MEACLHPARKRHARFRHQPRATPLWVGDPDDWALVRHKPRPPLVCPEPGCDVALISYENLNNQYNPRIFKFKATAITCSHWDASGLGGGPPSAEHEWMKLYLSRIATSLGYTATPEHAPTRADVFDEITGEIGWLPRPAELRSPLLLATLITRRADQYRIEKALRRPGSDALRLVVDQDTVGRRHQIELWLSPPGDQQFPALWSITPTAAPAPAPAPAPQFTQSMSRNLILAIRHGIHEPGGSPTGNRTASSGSPRTTREQPTRDRHRLRHKLPRLSRPWTSLTRRRWFVPESRYIGEPHRTATSSKLRVRETGATSPCPSRRVNSTTS
jgi:hypothetical protein